MKMRNVSLAGCFGWFLRCCQGVSRRFLGHIWVVSKVLPGSFLEISRVFWVVSKVLLGSF